MPSKAKVTPQEIRKLAGLAKLHLTAEQCEQYAGQITRILEHVDTLESADISGLAPLSNVLELVDISRVDDPVPSMERKTALGNAPLLTDASGADQRASDGEFFLVPGIIKTSP